MMKRTTYDDLLKQNAFLLECGSGCRIELAIVNEEDYSVMLELDGEMYKNVHLYEELEFEDTLIIINGRYYEAYIEQKLSFKA